MKFFGNINTALASKEDLADSGDFVGNLLYTAVIALAAVAVGGWIGGAIMNKGADIGACIEGASVTAAASAEGECQKHNHAKTKSFKNDKSYTDRFSG